MPAMEVVVRPARAGDGADLARGWTDAGRYYAELDPDAFQVPAADGLARWLEELLRRPRSADQLWLVADWSARSRTPPGSCCATSAGRASTSTRSAWRSATDALASAPG